MRGRVRAHACWEWDGEGECACLQPETPTCALPPNTPYHARLTLQGEYRSPLTPLLSRGAGTSYGTQVRTAVGDVSSASDVARMWGEFSSPTVDVLVANAGVNRPGALVDVSEADFDTVMATNVKGVFLSLKQVLPSMLDRGCGQIVVTNSVLVRTSSQ